MFKNVLRFYLRCLLVGLFLIFFSAPAFSSWSESGLAVCNDNLPSDFCASSAAGRPFYTSYIPGHGWCPGSDNGLHICYIWIGGDSPCPAGEVWHQSSQSCVSDTPPPPDCSQQIIGSVWNGEACLCPAGTTQGYQCTMESGCSDSCINPNPPEGCPEGQLQFQVDGEDRCFDPYPPDTCPEGSYPIMVDGVEQCWTPDQGSDQCPDGTWYVEINEVGQCYNPQPNIDDPDDGSSSSSSSSGGDGGSSSSSGIPGGSNFDDSGITSRLDQTNNKLDSANSKLDKANNTLTGMDEKLGDIKSVLDGPAQSMPGHSQASAQTFAEANANFATRVGNAPVVAAMNSFKNLISVSAAECPTLEIDLDGPIQVSAESDFHCTMWAQYIAPVFSVLIYIMYLWVAFRVFGSA